MTDATPAALDPTEPSDPRALKELARALGNAMGRGFPWELRSESSKTDYIEMAGDVDLMLHIAGVRLVDVDAIRKGVS